MTTPTHAHPAMTDPPDTEQPHRQPAPQGARSERPAAAAGPPQPEQPPGTAGPAQPAASGAAAAAGGRPWAANALVAALTAAVTVMGAGIVALLVHEFNSIDTRFVTLEQEVGARFVRLEQEMDAGFAEVDARFDSLEEGQNEIARTLAVLVAELNARAAVDAALAGRLQAPETAGPETAGPDAGPAQPGSAEP